MKLEHILLENSVPISLGMQCSFNTKVLFFAPQYPSFENLIKQTNKQIANISLTLEQLVHIVTT
jgi:hypothetical protein